MTCTVHSFTLDGIVARHVRVVADLVPGLPGFTVSGLPDAAVRECRERVRAAIVGSGFDCPAALIKVRIWPERRRPASPTLDLAIVAAVLGASGQVRLPARTAAVGSVGPSGVVTSMRGAVSAAEAAREHYVEKLLVPAANATEAAVVDGPRIVPLDKLGQLRSLSAGDWPTEPVLPIVVDAEAAGAPDLRDLRGQPRMRRALEVAGAGGHGLLMVGPAGAGISLAAARLPSILPPLRPDEALDVARIASATGRGSDGLFPLRRPFRAPHPTIGEAGLIGGGIPPRPGEVTLAHRGVLFLDYVEEFRRGAIEALAGPARRGEVTIARGAEERHFPCRFHLVAGRRTSIDEPCDPIESSDGEAVVDRHGLRIPDLAEQIEITVALDIPSAVEIAGPPGESSAEVRERVVAARKMAEVRLGDGRSNAEMDRREIRGLLLDPVATAILTGYRAKSPISDRGVDAILRVARTVADLDGAELIASRHVTEAISLR